jgi:hypothetical protein
MSNIPAKSAVFISILGLLPYCYRPVLRAIYLNPKWDDDTAIANMKQLFEIARNR